MARFVWITADLAEPPRAGGELRASRLISALARDHHVSVVLLTQYADVRAISNATGAAVVEHFPPVRAPIRKRARALIRRLPLASAAVYDRRVAAHVRLLAERGDVVIADHLQTAPYLKLTHRGVLNLHNSEAAQFRIARPPKRLGRRIEFSWDVAATSRLETWAIQTAARIVCVSELDRSLLGLPSAVVVPNGTDVPQTTTPVPRHGSLVFVGSMNYPPNADGVRWWLSEVVQHLPADMPPLTVIGRSAATLLADVAEDPRLNLIGDVVDVEPYLEAASVVVVPLLHGSGSRLKLIEGLAWGRPVVSTRKGAEGFPVSDGTELLLADEGRAFADAVALAYQDPAVAAGLARQGRSFAEDYDWAVIGPRFVAAVRAAAS